MAIIENKQKALAAALGQIEKQFGKGSIMRLGEDRSMNMRNYLQIFIIRRCFRCGWIATWPYC